MSKNDKGAASCVAVFPVLRGGNIKKYDNSGWGKANQVTCLTHFRVGKGIQVTCLPYFQVGKGIQVTCLPYFRVGKGVQVTWMPISRVEMSLPENFCRFSTPAKRRPEKIQRANSSLLCCQVFPPGKCLAIGVATYHFSFHLRY